MTQRGISILVGGVINELDAVPHCVDGISGDGLRFPGTLLYSS